MNIETSVASLKRQVDAAVEEFDMAIVFHEVWKPAAFDKKLHDRMGVSYASNAFHTIRAALRREVLLALMRLCDNNTDAVRLRSIANILQNADVVEALAVQGTGNLGIPGALNGMSADISAKAKTAIALIDKYSEGGSGADVLRNLKALRNKRLAHRQVKASVVAPTDATGTKIEIFYSDMSSLIGHLLSLAAAISYDPEVSAQVHRRYAELFWQGVRGEKTEGHPSYRALS